MHNIRNKLNNPCQNCVITGGSSGLGKAIASQVLRKGGNVIIIARNKSQLEEAAKYLEKDKISPIQKITSISADVTNFESVKTMIEQIEVGSKIDVLFSCAGKNSDSEISKILQEAASRVSSSIKIWRSSNPAWS